MRCTGTRARGCAARIPSHPARRARGGRPRRRWPRGRRPRRARRAPSDAPPAPNDALRRPGLTGQHALRPVLEHLDAAELHDLVAERGRALEFELLRGFLHLALEVLDESRELVRRHLAGGDRATALLVLALDLGDLLEAHAHLADRLHDAGRLDAVLLVPRHLELAAALGLTDRAVHRIGPPVGVHDHSALEVPRRAADDLDERAFRAQVALLVRV